MRTQIEEVKPLKKYKPFIHITDGTEGILDLSHLKGQGVFQWWDEDDNFSKVFVNSESKAITCPGEIDIDTYNAYFRVKNITPEDYFKEQKQHAAHL